MAVCECASFLWPIVVSFFLFFMAYFSSFQFVTVLSGLRSVDQRATNRAIEAGMRKRDTAGDDGKVTYEMVPLCLFSLPIHRLYAPRYKATSNGNRLFLQWWAISSSNQVPSKKKSWSPIWLILPFKKEMGRGWFKGEIVDERNWRARMLSMLSFAKGMLLCCCDVEATMILKPSAKSLLIVG